MVSPASHKLTGVRGTQDSGRAPSCFLYGIVTLSDRSFQNVRVQECAVLPVLQPHPFARTAGLGCSRFARHYFGNLMLISFSRATEMFQFTHYPPFLPIYSAGGLQTSLWRGCPIRTLRAPRSYAAPPKRFAGLRVLHRSSVPRHPPRTLCSLFFFVASFPSRAQTRPAPGRRNKKFLCFSSCSTAKLKKEKIQL